jgi:glycerophosphoryl diester phosphodiesterase
MKIKNKDGKKIVKYPYRNYSRYILIVILFLFISACKKKSKQQIKKNYVIEKINSLSKNSILVCAHRSFHKNSPENSLQSINDAIEANIDIVEIDIRTTKDSVLVLMHDKTIDRTTTGTGLVKDYTYFELQEFNLKISDSITPHKIPLVVDALKILKGKLIANLDLKAVDYKQLYQMLQELEMESDVISYIGKKEKILEMISIDSLYAVMPLVKTIEEMHYYYKNTKSPLQHFTIESFTEANMNWIHEKGELVFVNTLWAEDESFIEGNLKPMDSVIALKPAMIQTDHPKLLVEYLRSNGLHN